MWMCCFKRRSHLTMGQEQFKDKQSKLWEERKPSRSASAEQEQLPVQCVDDQAGLWGVIIYEKDDFLMFSPSRFEETPQDDGGK